MKPGGGVFWWSGVSAGGRLVLVFSTGGRRFVVVVFWCWCFPLLVFSFAAAGGVLVLVHFLVCSPVFFSPAFLPSVSLIFFIRVDISGNL